MAAQFEVIHPCCAGLDVHKKTVVACVRRVGPDGRSSRSPSDLRHHDRRPAGAGRLAATPRASATSPWSRPASTGSRSSTSWRAASRSILVNAQHIKQVPGRKTDVKDAEWIAQLLQHGLLLAQLRPAAADPRAARPDAAADPAGPRPRRGGQPHPEGAGGRQHQAGRRRHRRAGGLGPGDDRGADRRARRTRRRWPSWRGGGCGARSRQLQAGAARAGSPTTTASCSRMLMDQVEQLEGLIARVRRADRARRWRPFAEAAAAAGDDPRGGAAGGGGDRGGDRHGHDASSRRPATWRRGPGCARATTRAPASGAAARRPRGASGCGRRWCRWRGRPATPRRRSSAPYRRWAKRLGKKKALVAVAHKILVIVHRMLKDHTDYQELPARPDPCPEA